MHKIKHPVKPHRKYISWKCASIIRKFFRSAFILIVLFGLRIIFSCTPQYYDIFYNSINLTAVDNSGEYINSVVSDTLYSDAVAFELTLSDSFPLYGSLPERILRDLSFSPVLAFEVASVFIPQNRVSAIRVYTLFDLDSILLAGNDISDQVLYAPRMSHFIYSPLSSAVDFFNLDQGERSPSVYLILKYSVHNSLARFRVDVSFEDHTVLSDTTGIITIIPSPI